MTADRYAYSMDEEVYEGDQATREDALKEGMAAYDLEPGEVVYTGRKKSYTVQQLLAHYYLGHDVAVTLASLLYDRVGDLSDDWPKLTKEQEFSLDGVLCDTVAKWFDKNNLKPLCWEAVDVQKHVIGEE